MFRSRRDNGQLTLGKKIGISLMTMGFGIAVLVLSWSSGNSAADQRMRGLHERGQKATARLTGARPHAEGPQGAHEHVTYQFEVNGGTYTYNEAWYAQRPGEHPPSETTLIYLPEDPSQVERVLWQPQEPRSGPDPIALGFTAVGALMLIVTLVRIPANIRRDMDDRQEVARLRQEGIAHARAREFTYRQPLALAGAFFITVVPSIMIALFTKSVVTNETIQVNDRPTPAGEVWPILLFLLGVGGIFIVLGVLMLLAYVNERILWGTDEVIWYDRMGRLKVRAPLSGILSVRLTPLHVNRVSRISIDTTHGEIRFLDSSPWADTLKGLAEAAADENKRGGDHA